MQGDHWLIRKDLREDEKERILSNIMQMIRFGMEGGSIFVQIHQAERAYTPSQHAAIWKFCSMVASALRKKGVTLRALLESMRRGGEIEVTKEAVKYQMWAPVQKATTGNESMKALKSNEVGGIYDHINRFLINEHGIHIPFPSKDILYEGE